jgi:chemotaxis-related protein WspD
MQSAVSEIPGDVAFDACWGRIGVEGDHSCPRLPQAVHCRNCPVFSAAGGRLFEREAPPGYLAEWTSQLAEVEAAGTEMRSLLVFRVADEWLAIEVHSVVEVVEPRRIHRIPHRTDRLLLGLVNIRGELQLCISLRELLGIESAEDGSSPEPASSVGSKERLLVAEHDQNRWVFPVDRVKGVCRVPAAAMTNLPHTVEKSPRFYCQAVFPHNDKRVGLLSETRLFPALEKTIR